MIRAMRSAARKFRPLLLLGALIALAGCDLVLLNPAGDVAQQQGDLIVYATIMMMLVIGPVMALTVFFAWNYRASNDRARYEPEWGHSISLEIVIWAVPLAIIIVLAGLTWVATHRLDPYADLRRISEDIPMTEDVEPMEVQVVALDWKWLFIYPEEQIASVGEMAVIKDRPVEFKLTSNTVMNAFYIPDMAGMIYAMAGMETELNAVLNAPGGYEGFAANYNGAGFSQMRFDVQSFETEAQFDAWVETVRAEGNAQLSDETFNALALPSTFEDVVYYASLEDGVYDRILNMCTQEGQLCLDDQMMVDALGGGGIDGLFNRQMYAGLCDVDDPRALMALLRPEADEDETRLLALLMPPSETDLPLQSRSN
ncbi:MAG: ubiquinol oxidase subunit II [Pseudomonadota bacterium]